MKNILYVNHDAHLGGASLSLRDSLLTLRKYVNVFVILPDKGPLEDYFNGENIPYEIIPFKQDWTRSIQIKPKEADDIFLDNWRAAKKICDVIRQKKIDLVHVNTSVVSVGAFAALMCGVPYVYHVRELLLEQFGGDFYDWDVKRKVLENADTLIAISDFVKNAYLKKYGLNCLRVYNGLDISKYYKKIARNWTSPRFLVSGRVTREKGQGIAVHALGLLKERGYSNVCMDIVGNGDKELFRLREFMHYLGVENQVFIRGFQNDQTEFSQNCDYALTVSRNEALGRVTIEAMLAGQFVIGADEGGTKEIIGENEERGLLFAHGNAVALADKMEQAILMSTSEKEKIIKDAQKYALSAFSYEQYAISISRLYDKVCSEYYVSEQKKNALIWLESKFETASKIASDGVCVEDDVSKFDYRCYASKIREWFGNGEGSKQLAEYLDKNKIKTVAVYGMGNMGTFLRDVLFKKNISIVQMIDAGADYFDNMLGIRNKVDEGIPVDLMIVSMLKYQKFIVDDLRRKYKMNVIGLVDLYKLNKNDD